MRIITPKRLADNCYTMCNSKWTAEVPHNIARTFPATLMSHKGTLCCPPSAEASHFPVN